DQLFLVQVQDILLKAGLFTGKALFLQMFPNGHSWYTPICQDAHKKIILVHKSSSFSSLPLSKTFLI
ncbi:hypothetical protein, partial [Bacillus atrophaeus]|uniref:hypothetical protein n=1 Tax=Bacillus atrophaeus TaxID=1452 RepID=UPI0022817F34